MQYYFIIVGGKKLSRIVEKFILKLIEYQNIRLFINSINYNYYNNTHRMTVDKPKDWYQQMVDRYNSDELKAKDEGSNPYSEINLSIRALDEKLADWAYVWE